jgi:branched-subunit amino acid ABC-type transport system permease component
MIDLLLSQAVNGLVLGFLYPLMAIGLLLRPRGPFGERWERFE